MENMEKGMGLCLLLKTSAMSIVKKRLANATECRDVTNSGRDHKLPLADLWLFLVEIILSKERIQNYSFFLISRKMKPREM